MNHLDPKAVWIFFFRSLLMLLYVLIFALYFFGSVLSFYVDSPTGGKVIIGTILALLLWIIVSWIWAKLSYNNYKYELSDLGFKREMGVIFKKYVTIPYDRIQNVDIHRGIIARILGLSDLQIQTAGFTAARGVSSEGRLPGISAAEAEKLRDELVRRASTRTQQGL